MMMLCAFVSNANAALISWTAEVFNAASQVSTNGSLIEAINFNGTNATVNTVAFMADPKAGDVTGADTDYLVVEPFKVIGRGAYTAATVYTGSVTEMQPVLDSFRFNTRADQTGFQLTGLTVGEEYEVQIWIGDARTATIQDRYMTINGTRIPFSGAWGTSMYIATGTFTADAITQDLTLAMFNNANDAALGTQLPAYQLRSIPEPSSLSLCVVFAIALMGLRRWKI
ncbi:hypothetical protein [Kiritimatiella glycovorans]|uniref:PEP-CTERM protein-sorting domain-containing protein n=1 Tax=Kiritimatiella glycovorans TaxID=1307763 RepID=A0A0G3EK74_9BACT|nr:hypothetical protein [Kiritimatiella glycovorans]AKJ64564.1 hypothetical protein L21SP4_01316 [Kiritimatiella glycovorans]